jgi:two-component system KDP operon response regulator KdpE
MRALMAGLQRKIKKNPGKPHYIMTEVGVEYRLADE